MTINDILKSTESSMKKTIEAYKEHLMKIRTGRANPNMLNGVMVNFYGSMTPIDQTSQISSPEPQLIVVKPYDKSTISDINTGIEKANLGLNPIADAEVIRIPVPPLTEEIRKDTVKRMYKDLETFKIRIRNERRAGLDQAKAQTDISEDMVKGLEKDIQVLTDKFIKELDSMSKEKETALMTI